jgi:hypothetical protein
LRRAFAKNPDAHTIRDFPRPMTGGIGRLLPLLNPQSAIHNPQ